MIKIYLAIPFSGYEKVSFKTANRLAAYLIDKHYIVFSPISHSYPISFWCKKNDHDLWLKQDKAFVDWCDELWVVKLEGWQESKGVRQELRWAHERKIPVRIIDPLDYLIYPLTKSNVGGFE